MNQQNNQLIRKTKYGIADIDRKTRKLTLSIENNFWGEGQFQSKREAVINPTMKSGLEGTATEPTAGGAAGKEKTFANKKVTNSNTPKDKSAALHRKFRSHQRLRTKVVSRIKGELSDRSAESFFGQDDEGTSSSVANLFYQGVKTSGKGAFKVGRWAYRKATRSTQNSAAVKTIRKTQAGNKAMRMVNTRIREAAQTAAAKAASAAAAATQKTTASVVETLASTAAGKGVAMIAGGLIVICLLFGSCFAFGGGVSSSIKAASSNVSAVVSAVKGLDSQFLDEVKSAAGDKTIVDTQKTDAAGIAALIIYKGIDPSKSSPTLTEAVKRYYTQLNSYSVDDQVIVTRKTVESMLDQFGYKTDEEKTAFLEMRKSVQSVISSSGTAFTNAYTEYINQYAEKYELDTAMIYAIIEIESGFSMESVNNSLLNGGFAHGLMQIVKVGFDQANHLFQSDGDEDLIVSSISELAEPEIGIRYGCRLLRYNLDQLPNSDLTTVAVSYNAGVFQVQQWLSNPLYSHNGTTLIPDNIPFLESKNYAKKFQSLYQKYVNWGNSGNGTVTGDWIWPAPGTTIITSGVGPRWGTQHNGIDISGANCYGNPVVAADGGTVIVANKAGWGGGYGLCVYIDHGNGWITRYGHGSKVVVNVGDQVSKGQKIMEIGSTGQSTGDHLHFEMRYNDTIIDPEEYVSPY